MPAGDAQRIWFPELVEKLRKEWKPRLSLEEMISLRDSLDSILQAIRRERHILPPMMRCSRCGTRQRSAPPKVSVRAVILALQRFFIASESEVKSLDKQWRSFRKTNKLDQYGAPENVILFSSKASKE